MVADPDGDRSSLLRCIKDITSTAYTSVASVPEASCQAIKEGSHPLSQSSDSLSITDKLILCSLSTIWEILDGKLATWISNLSHIQYPDDVAHPYLAPGFLDHEGCRVYFKFPTPPHFCLDKSMICPQSCLQGNNTFKHNNNVCP